MYIRKPRAHITSNSTEYHALSNILQNLKFRFTLNNQTGFAATVTEIHLLTWKPELPNQPVSKTELRGRNLSPQKSWHLCTFQFRNLKSSFWVEKRASTDYHPAFTNEWCNSSGISWAGSKSPPLSARTGCLRVLHRVWMRDAKKKKISISFLMYTKFSFQSKKENYFLQSAELWWYKYSIGDFFTFSILWKQFPSKQVIYYVAILEAHV